MKHGHVRIEQRTVRIFRVVYNELDNWSRAILGILKQFLDKITRINLIFVIKLKENIFGQTLSICPPSGYCLRILIRKWVNGGLVKLKSIAVFVLLNCLLNHKSKNFKQFCYTISDLSTIVVFSYSSELFFILIWHSYIISLVCNKSRT